MHWPLPTRLYVPNVDWDAQLASGGIVFQERKRQSTRERDRELMAPTGKVRARARDKTIAAGEMKSHRPPATEITLCPAAFADPVKVVAVAHKVARLVATRLPAAVSWLS